MAEAAIAPAIAMALRSHQPLEMYTANHSNVLWSRSAGEDLHNVRFLSAQQKCLGTLDSKEEKPAALRIKNNGGQTTTPRQGVAVFADPLPV